MMESTLSTPMIPVMASFSRSTCLPATFLTPRLHFLRATTRQQLSTDASPVLRQEIHDTELFEPSTFIRLQNLLSYASRSSTQPLSLWQRKKPQIVVWATSAICLVGFGYRCWAVREASQHRNHGPLRFLERNFEFSQANMRAGRWWTFVTSSLMHYHPIHLAMNMMGLVSIGSVIVQVFGASAFLVTWVGAAVCSSWGSLLWERNRERILGRKGANNASSTHLRGHVESRSIGASGSILGLIAIATCLAPRATVRIFPVPVGISLWAYTVALTGLSGAALINGWLPWIGHAGHLGGMVFGLVFYQYPLKRLLRIPRF